MRLSIIRLAELLAHRIRDRVRRGRTIAVAVVGIVGAVIMVGLLLPGNLTGFDKDGIVAQVRAWGTLGPLALVVFFVLQAVIAPLPAPPLLVAAGFIYGPWFGFAIGWFGLLLGASACFVLARALGRPFAARFIGPARLTALDRYIGDQSGPAFLIVVSLRLFIPPAFDAVSYACGLVELPFRWFALGTALGEVPKVATFTYLGAVAGSPPTWLTAWIMLLPAVGVLVLRFLHRRRRAAGAEAPSPEHT